MTVKIAFCHIHKTAGTTVSRYLRSNYPRDAIFPSDGIESVNQHLIDTINDYSLIVGHFPLSFLRAFLNSEWQIVTTLRDPLARFKSHVAFSHELTSAGAGGLTAALQEDSEYLASMSDFQTCFLGTWFSPDEWRFLVSSGQSRRYHMTEEWRRGRATSALRIACEELSAIPHVLDSGAIDAGLRHLAMTCGLWPCESLPVANRGSYRSLQTSEERQQLDRLSADTNQLDLRLIEHAQDLYVPAPSAEQWDLYRLRWMERQPESTSAFVAADHCFMGTGWHEPERGAEGVAFCWSDSTLEQAIYMPLRIPGLYELRLSLYVPGGRPDFVASAAFNGQPMLRSAIHVRRTEWMDCTFEFRVSSEATTRPIRFTLHTNCSPRPRPAGDLRDLGYVFSGAIVRALEVSEQ